MSLAIRPKPVVLAILDGWGHRDARENNAIAQARTPFFDRIMREYPHGLINASEEHVGLPKGQMGNSEVGHMNIGSGRVLMQDLPRIDAAIENGELAKNPRLLEFISKLRQSGGTCHLLGLVSNGGVHSHQAHIAALANIVTKHGVKVWIHAFLDGRDTPPQSALEYIAQLEKDVGSAAKIATVSGRYYAMDRDNRWDRIEKAYDAITLRSECTIQGNLRKHTPRAPYADNAREAVTKAYADGITDEFIIPTIVHDDYEGISPADGLLMVNFRADRARQLLTAFLDPVFDGFVYGKEFTYPPTLKNERPKFSAALGMCEYSAKHNDWMQTIFPPQVLTNIFGEIIANAGLKQLRIAETEKYAHVTFFFNGGREEEFPGESRILVPSPKVATYDLKPEMSAPEVTDKLIAAIESEQFDVIVVNYANTDMVGHSGDIKAAIRAVEAVDSCLAKLEAATLAKGGALVITADHGNAEMMHDNATHQAHTAHTLSLVPLVIIESGLKGSAKTLPEGKLSDIAPTLLDLLQLPKPAEMTGRSLLPHAS